MKVTRELTRRVRRKDATFPTRLSKGKEEGTLEIFPWSMLAVRAEGDRFYRHGKVNKGCAANKIVGYLSWTPTNRDGTYVQCYNR
jgi:hypothetical protein